MGMVGVDKIGEIRRAYFEQDRSIKEIVRTLSVSRATVRKVIRSHKTEFKYARGVQPTPKLGDWVEVLTEILEQESKLPKRERRSTQRLSVRGREGEFEAARGLIGEPSFGLLGDVRGMIVKDQLDCRTGWIGGVEKLQEFDEFAAAVAIQGCSML